MKRLFKLTAILALLLTLSGVTARAQAPTPTPVPTPTATADSGVDLTSSLRRMSNAAMDFVPAFVREVEKPLGGYFEFLAWWLAWLVFMVAFLRVIRGASDDPTEIFWICARGAVIFALLGYMGDTNGDGIRGDLINDMGSVGYTIAYGRLNNEGATGYLQRVVSQQQTVFNKNYRDFIDNSFTVQVNNDELPIKYPTDGTPYQRLSVLFSKGDDLNAVNQAFNPAGWSMENLFQWLNGARTLVEFGDLFLLVLQGFLVATMRLAAPFMIAVAMDREWAKRVSYNFAWAVVIVTLVMPIISQVIRFLAYLAGNLAMDLASSQPYYKWDPTTLKIVAVGNPVWIIMIATVVMTFAALCMIGSPWISFKLASGQVLEAATGMVTSWFGAATSTAMSAYSAAAGAALNKQAEQIQIQGNTSAEQISTQSTRLAANTEARNRAAAESIRSRSTAQEASTNAIASASAQNERAAAGQERTERTETMGFEAEKTIQEGKVLAEQNKAEVANDRVPYEVAKGVPLIGPIVGGGLETAREVGSTMGAAGRNGPATGSGAPTTNLPGRTPLMLGTVTGRETFQPQAGNNFSLQRDGGGLAQAFEQQFHRPIPARVGQQDVHNRNGMDHRNAMDVAVNPNSAEGRWVRTYCIQHGIPYNAFDRAMKNSTTGKTVATGPHIHIGKSSGSSFGQQWATGTTVPTGNRPPLSYQSYEIPNRTGQSFPRRAAMAPLDAARIESNYTLGAAMNRANENIDASRVETGRVINANNAEASLHVGAAWTADAQRQRAIGLELGGSLKANQIRYDGSMAAIKVRHDAMMSAAKLHAVNAVYTGTISAAASQMQSVWQQFNRY